MRLGLSAATKPVLEWLFRNVFYGPSSLALLENPYLAAKLYPYQRDRWSYLIPKPTSGENKGGDAELPIPPPELWEGYGASAEEYLASGQENVSRMREILAASGFSFESGMRVLDFGCAGSRMIRWFRDVASQSEVWGVDISAAHIAWCQQHLSPPFRFATTTSFPHLPFEDRSFDLIYAGSVFTHISDLADAWLLELRRILRPEGRLYVTVSDKHTLDLILHDTTGQPFLRDFQRLLRATQKETPFLNSDFAMLSTARSPRNAHVFYDIDYLRQKWARFLDILSVTPEAYGYQTAVVLQKQSPS